MKAVRFQWNRITADAFWFCNFKCKQKQNIEQQNFPVRFNDKYLLQKLIHFCSAGKAGRWRLLHAFGHFNTFASFYSSWEAQIIIT